MQTSLSPRAQRLLDKALDGQSQAVKARVLQMVLDLEISPDEEFFAICIALNHLQVLLVDAPQQLEAWAANLQQQLNNWTLSHMQTLHLIAQKAEATAALTDTASQLATMLTSHTQTCNALIRQLQVSHQTWGNSWEQQETVNDGISKTLAQISEQLNEQKKQLRVLSVEVQANKQSKLLASLGIRSGGVWNQALVFISAGAIVIGSIALSALTFLYVQDRALIHRTAEKLEYLFQQQNQQDCLTGTARTDDFECQ
ncbi:MAG: DUF6753 family protein [Cyanobacteria bacterium P01_A01_bin.17]